MDKALNLRMDKARRILFTKQYGDRGNLDR